MWFGKEQLVLKLNMQKVALEDSRIVKYIWMKPNTSWSSKEISKSLRWNQTLQNV